MVTIKTIAQIAGVSHTTVSRALNDSPLLRAETKTKIQALAKEMGYVPNLSARGLARETPNTIGLFFSSLGFGTTGDFIQTSIEALNSVIGKQYHITIHTLDAIGSGAMLSPSNYDGVVIVSMDQHDDFYIRKVMESGIPCAVVNRDLEQEFLDGGILSVRCQEKEGVYQAVQQMAALGHTQIGYIRGLQSSVADQRRWAGFCQAMEDCGLPVQSQFVCAGDFGVASGYAAAKQLASLDTLPTLVFCASDAMAFGALRLFHEKGISVPETISVVGFDNCVHAMFSVPGLSSIERPIARMVQQAGALLLQTMQGEIPPQQDVRFATRFFHRESVRAL